MSAEDLADFDGPWVEDCELCEGTGAVQAPLGQRAICPDCEGSCFVTHECEPEA